ncbi:SRPBCC family protein [Auraticoccus monumenti]|uniref:Polyketide cyclase / dehydrase and lipid transport n=1 Tax=Auraticoccus monumenti TaxID=675864 RepID=A0A1G7BT00_9ACTN|nr:SRPBCC family protein [Auraticoccus monumenti]SDE29325.1 Polyketide cyclase / dehydrase and lipid transport [Auraticoccus monumenti]
MSTVQSSVDVDVPIARAYNQWTQFETFPQFMDGVTSVTHTDDTHTHWVVKVGAATREFDTEITDQRPDELVAWRSTGGDGGRHTGRVTFQTLGASSTRVNIALSWDPRGLVEKAGVLLHMDQVAVAQSAAEFKSLVEKPGSGSVGWRGDVTGV